MSAETDKILAEYLGRKLKEEAEGYTPKNILKAIDTISQGLQTHEKECLKRWEENEKKHASTHSRLVTLEAKVGIGEPEEDAAEITGSHNVEVIARKVQKAVMEGIESPDKSPDEMVRKVVSEEQAKLEEKAELKRLRQKEEDAKRTEDTQEHESRETKRLIFVGVASAVGGSGVLAFVAWLAQHWR